MIMPKNYKKNEDLMTQELKDLQKAGMKLTCDRQGTEEEKEIWNKHANQYNELAQKAGISKAYQLIIL